MIMKKSTMTSKDDVLNHLDPNHTHIRVIWEDTIDNHSDVREKEVKKYFENKYNTNKVKVVFTPIKHKNVDLAVESNADASEVILDSQYQKTLIEKFLSDGEYKTPVDLIYRLDDSINVDLEDYKDNTSRHKTFNINWIEFSNFLSFGDNNRIDFNKLKGLTSVISDPPNYGGKTSGTIDLILFLFFGVTTKTTKLEEIFNRYTDKDLVRVKGSIDLEGETLIIERTISRVRGKCKSNLEFYQVMPRGGIKELKGEQRSFTDELIKTYVGTYDDFILTILATGDNLDSLISTKPTERGHILTRFIGLEFFREKEKIAKKKYSDWKLKSKLHTTNKQDVNAKIETQNDIITNNNLLISDYEKQLIKVEKLIVDDENLKDSLFKSRFNDVDNELYKLNESDINDGINKLENLISVKNNQINDQTKVNQKPKSEFDIDTYQNIKKEIREISSDIDKLKITISNDESNIKSLMEGENCKLCKQPLKGVNNKDEINRITLLVSENKDKLIDREKKLSILEDSLQSFDSLKQEWDEYNKNNLIIDRLKLELKAYEDNLKKGRDKLTTYLDGKNKIEKNKEIDTKINSINIKINRNREERDGIKLQITTLKKENEISNKNILEYNDLLKLISKEEKIDDTFRTYLDIFGKNGISKMVLSTMIPIINSYIKVLLSESCEFDLNVRLNEKTEVEFWMIDHETNIEKPLNSGSGYEKTISSLALRCVLSKVCSLPKPNIIMFDEIGGKVSNDNLDKLGLFFDKLKTYFDNIWNISHNPYIQEWSDNVIKIRKINNISQID